jgi:hypothetical protein
MRHSAVNSTGVNVVWRLWALSMAEKSETAAKRFSKVSAMGVRKLLGDGGPVRVEGV